MQTMYYIRLDVRQRTISNCVKEGSAVIHSGGANPGRRGAEVPAKLLRKIRPPAPQKK
jgi:hypothetical protein